MSGPGYSPPVYPNAISGTSGQQHDQYLRRWTLTLGQSGALGGTGGGTVITTETPGYDFRMVFRIRHADWTTPGTAEIRIYNLADSTAADLVNEFDTVQLQAGYITGHYGTIFQGTIKQYKRGRESAVDSYLDIFAADGDYAWNYGFLHGPYPPGTTSIQLAQKIADAAVSAGGNVRIGEMTAAPIVKAPRTVIQYGSLADEADELARTMGTTWSIQNGEIQHLNSTAYKQGEIVVINSSTGMIGAPEITNDWIYVTCLLNPNLYVRGRVQLDNKSINQYYAPGGVPIRPLQGTDYKSLQFRELAPIAQDGVYVILVIDHTGDTRGLPWYSHITCLTTDLSATTAGQVDVPAGGWQVPE
jgi:hypothetical protein